MEYLGLSLRMRTVLLKTDWEREDSWIDGVPDLEKLSHGVRLQWEAHLRETRKGTGLGPLQYRVVGCLLRLGTGRAGSMSIKCGQGAE